MNAYLFLVVMGFFLGVSWLLRLLVSERIGRRAEKID